MPRLTHVLLATLLLCGSPAWAILDKNSSANTANPLNGSPWANVGTVNGATGIYIGNGWVLSAGHVGTGAITFDIGTFQAEDGGILLSNPEGAPEPFADLRLFHLSTLPNLPSLALSDASPAFGLEVQYIGYGKTRGSAEKIYYSNPAARGFDWSAGGSKSWGTNTVSSAASEYVFHTLAFSTTFDRLAGTSHEAQATLGDSGSGVFIKNGNTWQLAGIVSTISTVAYPGRAAGSEVALYGDATNSADLSAYRQQIVQVTGVPEPGAGTLLASAALVFAGRKGRVQPR